MAIATAMIKISKYHAKIQDPINKNDFSIAKNALTTIFQKNYEIVCITAKLYFLKNKNEKYTLILLLQSKAWSKYTKSKLLL